MEQITLTVPTNMSRQTFLRVLSALTAGGFNEICGEPSDDEKAVCKTVEEAEDSDSDPVVVLRSVVDSYDDTGCEACGVIDESVYFAARKVLNLSEV